MWTMLPEKKHHYKIKTPWTALSKKSHVSFKGKAQTASSPNTEHGVITTSKSTLVNPLTLDFQSHQSTSSFQDNLNCTLHSYHGSIFKILEVVTQPMRTWITALRHMSMSAPAFACRHACMCVCEHTHTHTRSEEQKHTWRRKTTRQGDGRHGNGHWRHPWQPL